MLASSASTPVSPGCTAMRATGFRRSTGGRARAASSEEAMRARLRLAQVMTGPVASGRAYAPGRHTRQ